MTPEERAAIWTIEPERMHGVVAAIIRAAIAKEREACAALAEDFFDEAAQTSDIAARKWKGGQRIADAIRART